MKKPAKPAALPCPCGRDRPYAECCGRYHAGLPAPDAESLMRSRYSAYVRNDAAYLLATWHPDTRPAQLDLNEDKPAKWLGLEVLRHAQSDAEPAGVAGRAVVEFVARFKVDGRAQRMHETSRFVHEDGRWFYLDGDVRS